MVLKNEILEVLKSLWFNFNSEGFEFDFGCSNLLALTGNILSIVFIFSFFNYCSENKTFIVWEFSNSLLEKLDLLEYS